MQPGLSELTLRAAYPDKYPDMLYVNAFELDYQRTYSATDDLLLFSVDAHDAWKFVLTEFSTDSITVCNITDPFAPTLILQGDVTGGDPPHTVTFESLAGPDSRFIATARDQWMTPQIEEDEPSDLHSDLNGADYIIIAPEEFHASLEPLAQHRASQGMRVETVNLEDIYDEFGFGLLDPEAIRDFLSHAYQSWTWPRPRSPVHTLTTR